MRNVLYLIAFFFILSACSSENNFQINGQLPDNSYDGEWIYLVPLVNAPVERVDSTVIENGAFVFNGNVKVPEIYVIRPRPFIRLSLQELLVVKEPGQINAYIGQRSKAKGTALNDSLQSWKEQKEVWDVKSSLLQQQFTTADDSTKDELLKRKKQINTQKNTYNFEFAKNNKNNVVGEMVIRFTKASFTDMQKRELGID